MKLMDRLERKCGRFAIPNLMMYIVFGNAAVFLFDRIMPGSLIYSLMLIPERVFAGEVWRIFTFLLIPPTTNMFFLFFVLMFYYWIGTSIESTWGSFKFNVYYFTGVIILVITSFIFNIPTGPSYLNMTLFLAMAVLYPDVQINIYFILPIKIKYLAYLDGILLVLSFIMGGRIQKISVLAGVGNFLLFFLKDFLVKRKTGVKNTIRREQYKKSSVRQETYAHKCCICGITEKDNPDMEFRYCSKCQGHYEYCMDHLRKHEHKTTK